jgi:hypothetical protein
LQARLLTPSSAHTPIGYQDLTTILMTNLMISTMTKKKTTAQMKAMKTKNDDDGAHSNTGNADSDGEHHHNPVIIEHTCHRHLQDQTAPQTHGGDAPNATFVCPVCRDVFDPKLPLYQFYRRLNTPLHHAYLASHGIMCEFGFGQGFLEEHYRFKHYATPVCPSM